jgi:type IV secretory pathway VirJ component
MEGSGVTLYDQRMFPLKRVLSFFLCSLLLNSVCGQLASKDTVKTGNRESYVNSQKLSNIPYIITRAKAEIKNTAIALLLSGDGGWFNFEQAIANNLASFGIPTIGIDTKKYFWSRKTPEKTTADMTEILNYYSKEWGKNKFILIGYSQGAEIVPFIVTLFPQNLRSNVLSAVLLSPAKTTDFEIHISNMLDLGNRQNTYDVIQEIKKLDNIRTICIYGDKEKSTVPALLEGSRAKFVFIPGDHHYHGNATLIVKVMKENKAF